MQIDLYKHVLIAYTKNCLLFALFSKPNLEFLYLAGSGLGSSYVVLGLNSLWLKSYNRHLALYSVAYAS